MAFNNREERDSAYKALFGSDFGKQVLEDMKITLQYGQTIFGDGMLKEDLHYYIGRQSVINDIINTLNRKDKG